MCGEKSEQEAQKTQEETAEDRKLMKHKKVIKFTISTQKSCAHELARS